MYVSVTLVHKIVIAFPEDAAPFIPFLPSAFSFSLIVSNGVVTPSCLFTPVSIFFHINTSHPHPPTQRVGSVSIIRSPLVCRATTYSYWGCDSPESGSRLLNRTSSVCSSVCRTASLRRLLCCAGTVSPFLKSVSAKCCKWLVHKAQWLFFDMVIFSTHVLCAETDTFSFLQFCAK